MYKSRACSMHESAPQPLLLTGAVGALGGSNPGESVSQISQLSQASPATLLLENDFASLDRSSDIHYTRQH